jgi:hypothetical protein
MPSVAAMLVTASFAMVGPQTHRVAAAAEASPCAGAQLDVGGIGSSAATGTGILTIRITNVTPVACTLAGRAQLEYFGPGGKPVVSQIGDVGPGAAFETPKPVMLHPGTSAGFVVTSRDLLQPGADCSAVVSIRIHLAGQKATFTFDLPRGTAWYLCGGRSHPTDVSALVDDGALNGYAPEWTACASNDLVLSLLPPGAASGAALVIVRLTDRLGVPCTLDGYPKLRLTTATGHTVLRFTSGRSAGTFPPPPLPRPVSLGDLGVAQFVFSAADYQVVADKACPSSTRLHLVLPDGSGMVQPHSFSLCGRGGLGPFTEPGILTQPYLWNGAWQRGGGAG